MRETNLIYKEESDIIHRVYKFDNGYGASVVKGYYTYGSALGLWELAVIKFDENGEYDLCYDTPITDNIIGFLSENDVDEILKKIENIRGAISQ